MKKPYTTVLILVFTMSILTGSASAAAVGTMQAQGQVIATGVIVPAQVSEIAFLIPGMVREIPVQEGDQVKTGQVLMMLDTPELEYAVVASEAAFRSAQSYAELQRYKRVKSRRHGRVFFDLVPPEVRERADAQARQAEAALAVTQATLAQNQFTAPFDATVVSVSVVPGEYVQPHQVVIVLATLDTLQVQTTDLGERDLPKVALGDPAVILVEALDVELGGLVTAISPIAETVGGDVVFKVLIDLHRQPERLLWGMTGEVTIGE